jgi:hypothetical protein
MKFQYIPIIDQMIEIYSQPLTYNERFLPYLRLLQTPNDGELAKAIPLYNPMAKGRILEILKQLKHDDVEDVIKIACDSMSDPSSDSGTTIDVYFNLADDIGGGWTDRESTIALSKNIKPYKDRNMAIVQFFASETITSELIFQRTVEYLGLYK